MGKHILHQILNGKPFTMRMESLDSLAKEYFVANSSLNYPDKVVLPLEDYCRFYFKELSGLKIKDRISIACNDSMSMFLECVLDEIYSGTSDPEKNCTNKDSDDSLSSSYAMKFAISKFAAHKYLRSNKSAAELLSDKVYWSKVGHRLLNQYIILEDEPFKNGPYCRLASDPSKCYVQLHPSGTRYHMH